MLKAKALKKKIIVREVGEVIFIIQKTSEQENLR